MKFRIIGVLLLMLALCFCSMAIAGSDDKEGDDKWGEAKIDHPLNLGWEYPADYIERPLVYSKRVTEFGLKFDYKYARDYWDRDGSLVRGPFREKKETLNVFIGLGISDNFSASLNAPFTYKKTMIFPVTYMGGKNNYRNGRVNTYGALAEDAVVDFFEHHEPWRVWEADLPQLGDMEFWMAYQVYKHFDWTTSVTIEALTKFATGNDNLRHKDKIRNYVASGNTDLYIGPAVKQQVWKFAFEFHGGYNWRMPAVTKYSAGDLNLADQLLGKFETAFQIPEVKPLWKSIALAGGVKGFYRIGNISTGPWFTDIKLRGESTIKDNEGNFRFLDDYPGYELIAYPKIVYQKSSSWDVYVQADIPILGRKSFLNDRGSTSFYVPPYDIESYEPAGIVYTLGVTKRWQ